MKITINGKAWDVDDAPLHYDVAARIGGCMYKTPTITWKDGPRIGSLVAGESVELHEGAVVNVAVTGAA